MIQLWPVLLASLAGSPHCGAMCGMIAGAAGRSAATAIAYQGARLAGYLTLGTIAGLAGGAVEGLGIWAGVAGLASRAAGVGLVLFGLLGILATVGRRPRPAFHAPWIGRLAAHGQTLRPTARAGLLGLVTALLPCGWLFAFVLAAAGTADGVHGALSMAVFWAGTVPAVASAGWLFRRLAGPAQAHLPAVAGAAMVIFGLLTAFGRIGPTPATSGSRSPVPAAHDHGAR